MDDFTFHFAYMAGTPRIVAVLALGWVLWSQALAWLKPRHHKVTSRTGRGLDVTR
jgi:hypothetical protein